MREHLFNRPFSYLTSSRKYSCPRFNQIVTNWDIVIINTNYSIFVRFVVHKIDFDLLGHSPAPAVPVPHGSTGPCGRSRHQMVPCPKL